MALIESYDVEVHKSRISGLYVEGNERYIFQHSSTRLGE